MTLRAPQEVEIDGRTLADIVERHQEWLGSSFRNGERAVLAGADLRRTNLAGHDLRQADLSGADLAGADLARAKLNGAKLQGANLRHAVLNGAAFIDDADPASTADSPLFGPTPIDMQDVRLGGADLTVALLPEDVPLTRQLRETGLAARSAVRIGAVLAAILVFTIAGLLRIRDANLLGNLPLPLIPFTPTIFYWIMPLALLFLYGWWHFSALGPLWRMAAGLPAFLPDGAALATHVGLRPFGSWVTPRMPLLAGTLESRWDHLRGWIVDLLVWWFTPLILFVFWWRYLVLHEPVGTFIQGAVAASALAIALSWRGTALAGLAANGSDLDRSENGRAKLAWIRPVYVAVGAAIFFGGFSYAAFHSKLPDFLGRSLRVQFEDFGAEPGVRLSGRNLQFAVIAYSNLRGADLSGAQLEGASLTVTDLASADLRGADLRGASFFSARLENALLADADLRAANLRCASGLSDKQLSVALTDESTVLPDGSQGPFQPGANTTRISIVNCTHWQPGGNRISPADVERFLRRFPSLPRTDLEQAPSQQLQPAP
jgi:uncharacterized protein YjbI with pentapeptide repeats